MPTSFDGYAEKVESLTSVFREFASRGLNGGSACGHGLSLFWTSNGRSRLVSPTGRVHDVPGRERSWYRDSLSLSFAAEFARIPVGLFCSGIRKDSDRSHEPSS